MSRRWCHACNKPEEFDGNWVELWVEEDGRLTVQPVDDPDSYAERFRSDIFACGQGSALLLVERWLHTRTFDPPLPRVGCDLQKLFTPTSYLQ